MQVVDYVGILAQKSMPKMEVNLESHSHGCGTTIVLTCTLTVKEPKGTNIRNRT